MTSTMTTTEPVADTMTASSPGEAPEDTVNAPAPPPAAPIVKIGARFFDAKKRDRGWAEIVSKRENPLSELTVLDVTTAEPSLASFLRTLDKGRLRVQLAGTPGESITFRWASGYENGAEIRVRGVLDHT